MTPEQLKASIIYSALKGNLVEQIDEEKEVDISGIKIKKTEELEFDIPEKWKTAHLESVTLSIASKQYQIAASEFKTSGKYPVVSQSKEYIIGYSDDEKKLFHHDNPIVIFGDHTTEVKYIDFDFVVGADGVKIFKPISNILFDKYLKYVLEYYSTGLEKVGGYTRHYKYIKDKPIPLPPLGEQYRIVTKIEELLPFVDRYAEAYEKLEKFNAKFPEDMKKSILQYAIMGKLVEQRPEEGSAEDLYKQITDDREEKIKNKQIKRDKRANLDDMPSEMPFDIPDNWKWVTLGSILLKLTDGTHKTPKYTESGVKFVSVKDMSSGVLSLDNTKYISEEEHIELFSRCDPQKGDMLLSKVGTTGVPAIIDTEEPFSLFVSVSLLKYNHRFIDEKFLYYLLQSPLVQDQASENTRGVGNKNWVLDAIGKTLIVLPPIEEQKRIVAKLEELLPYCDALI